ncbi:MAG: methyltransferase domain-containing protein [Planctomycetaceae bacterium]
MTQTIAANVMASTARSYDEVPYIGGAFPETHPNRLATLGTLFGMQPVDPLRCRVLELGCAQGKNLIPMASTAPHSEFIGIDLSAKQIDVGKNWIAQLRLGNIELRQQNILELTSDIGSFDYIIAHGVLSWVPQVVQEKIFDLCQQLLAPQGIAYLSYNTYPGWHFRDILRNQLCFHTRNAVDERQKFQQAEEYLGILQLAAKNHPGIYGDVLQAQIDLLRQSRDYYVFHDFLEEVNSPFYF